MASGGNTNGTANMKRTERRNILLKLCQFLSIGVSFGNGELCSRDELKMYKQCVQHHSPCPCERCDPDPTDGTPVIFVDRPSDCLDVQKIFCPLIRCCSSCETVAFAWYQHCGANPFALQYLGYTCPLDCSLYLYQDTCGPSPAPVPRRTRMPTISIHSSAPSPPPMAEEVVIWWTLRPAAIALPTMPPSQLIAVEDSAVLVDSTAIVTTEQFTSNNASRVSGKYAGTIAAVINAHVIQLGVGLVLW